jgi:protoporphyrinogen/coproporphyrinogen III oxidase
MTADVECLVIGAGIAGLAAAAELRRAGREVLVLEASDRVGGAAWSELIDGHLVEHGANTFRIPPAMDDFARDHALDAALVAAAPASRARFLVRGGALVPVPATLLAFARTPLLSTRGKLRLLAEPFARRGDASGESVAEFATRRLGREACDALVAPFLTGVYVGAESQLGAAAVFPRLVAAERRSGSIAGGLAMDAIVRRAPSGRPGTWSARGGIGALAAALADALGASLRVRTPASSIAFQDGLYTVDLASVSGAASIRCRSLVAAAPAPATGPLVGALDPEAGKAIEAIAHAPVASVSLSIEAGATRERVRGFGFLVPRGEGDALLGCLFPSRLFPERAPAGRELLTALVGGLRKPEALDWPDVRLVVAIEAELDRALGLRDAPRVLAITRWPHAVPQPDRDHLRTIAALRARLARFPRLAIAGAWTDGVAFGESLASGVRAARSILEER